MAGQLDIPSEIQILSLAPVASFQSFLSDESITVDMVKVPISSGSAQSSETTTLCQKRRRTTPREQQTEKLLQIEYQLCNGMKQIEEELGKTNDILRELADQAKTANTMHEQMVGWISYLAQNQSSRSIAW